MARSSWKIPYVPNVFISNFFDKKKVFLTRNRHFLISNCLVNKKFKIHNGIWMLSLTVKPDMVGHRLGEFSITKKLGREIHLKDKKKKR